MATTTHKMVRDLVDETAMEIIDDFDADTDRETLIERMDEETDNMFSDLVQAGMIRDYQLRDMVNTAGDCAAIIEVADQDSWVEDDYGLWEGMTYGVLASIAYFSLRNLLYSKMDELGVNSNDDYPLSSKESDDE